MLTVILSRVLRRRHSDSLQLSWCERRLGLLALQGAAQPIGIILIKPCKRIHTCFMQEPIDVAFINSSGEILEIILGVAPWRILSGPQGTTAVAESMSRERRMDGWKRGGRSVVVTQP